MGISGGRYSAFLIRSTLTPFASGSEASRSTQRIEDAALPGRNGASLAGVSIEERLPTVGAGPSRRRIGR